jgi:hypothetical protein
MTGRSSKRSSETPATRVLGICPDTPRTVARVTRARTRAEEATVGRNFVSGRHVSFVGVWINTVG